jgi:CBS domain-containing protein
MKRWRVADVMTTPVVSAGPDTGYDAVADLLVRYDISGVPVVAGDGTVLGVVSEADLLPLVSDPDAVPAHPLVSRRGWQASHAPLGATAGAVMTSPAQTICATAPLARAARQLAAGVVRRLPVVDDAGRLVGILTHRDLARPFARPDTELRAEILAEVGCRPVDVAVRDGVVTLTGRLDRAADRELLIRLSAAVPGVTEVVDRLTATPERVAGRTFATGEPVTVGGAGAPVGGVRARMPARRAASAQ